jgi:hypothetical protein
MLKVGIHHGENGCRARQHSFHAGRREPASADALDAAYSRVGARHRAQALGRAVGRVVVDEYHFPALIPEALRKPAHEFRHVLPFVERVNNDGKIGGNTLHIGQLVVIVARISGGRSG